MSLNQEFTKVNVFGFRSVSISKKDLFKAKELPLKEGRADGLTSNMRDSLTFVIDVACLATYLKIAQNFQKMSNWWMTVNNMGPG